MKKKVLLVLLTAVLALSSLSALANGMITMYAADGRTISVSQADVEAYEAVGWYTEPPVLMYAADGRTLYVIPSEIEAYKAVGWYTEPPVIMYAQDGRTIYVGQSEVEAYRAVGWSTEAPQRVMMYAEDGRVLLVYESQVEAYKAVGWYTEPFVEMYDANLNTIAVPVSQVEAYKAVGWYETLEEAYRVQVDNDNRETIGNFEVGMRVRKQTILYTAYGTVEAVSDDAVQVLWTDLYDSDGFRADWSTELSIAMFHGIIIGETSWEEPAFLDPMS